MPQKPSPNDLKAILRHVTPDDMPAGVTAQDTSTHDTQRILIRAGECTLATIHQHWMADAPKYYVAFDFSAREAEIDAMLHRIANAVNARMTQNRNEASAVLDALNLR